MHPTTPRLFQETEAGQLYATLWVNGATTGEQVQVGTVVAPVTVTPSTLPLAQNAEYLWVHGYNLPAACPTTISLLQERTYGQLQLDIDFTLSQCSRTSMLLTLVPGRIWGSSIPAPPCCIPAPPRYVPPCCIPAPPCWTRMLRRLRSLFTAVPKYEVETIQWVRCVPPKRSC